MEDAQTSKPPIQKFADRVSAYFVPSVLALSILTFIIWYSLGASGKVPVEWMQPNGPFLFAFLKVL